jgi:glyoxylase-like metal-dependent hydrolase (beta-lactamase superfamily II)
VSLIRVAPDQWYETRALSDGVTWIYELHIVPFFRCNIWHIRGRDRDGLVDSGMGVVSLREYVPIVSERPLIAVASHTHYDHIGAHAEFPERAVHAAEADYLAHPTRDNILIDPYVTDEIFTALPPLPFTSQTYSVKAAPATRILTDGDIIDLGDRHVEVVHTPGHSPGGIALWEAASGILFSGDIVYDGPLIEETIHSNAAHYIASMERLLKLPVRLVHGGHFPSFSGERHRELIRAWLTGKGRTIQKETP